MKYNNTLVIDQKRKADCYPLCNYSAFYYLSYDISNSSRQKKLKDIKFNMIKALCIKSNFS